MLGSATGGGGIGYVRRPFAHHSRRQAHRPQLKALGLVLEVVGSGFWVLGDSAADQTHHPLPTTHALKPLAHSERIWAWCSALARCWQWGVASPRQRVVDERRPARPAVARFRTLGAVSAGVEKALCSLAAMSVEH